MPSHGTRRRFLAACSALLPAAAAGCVGRSGTGAPGTDDTTTPAPALSEEFDCDEASRPTPDVPAGVDVEYEGSDGTEVGQSVGSVEYPDPPDPADDAAVEQYAAAHEAAYVRNDIVAGRGTALIGFGFSERESALVDRRDGLAFVRVEYAYYTTSVSDGTTVHGDSAIYAATYAVSDWGVARAVDRKRDTDGGLDPHPVEAGALVACFDGETDDGPSFADAFDCEAASRPTPDVPAGVEREYESGGETVTVESVGSVEYPDPPDLSDDEAVEQYATAHEAAYVRNEHAAKFGTAMYQFSVGVRQGTTVERTDGVAVVRFEYAYGLSYLDDEGRPVAADSPLNAAAYAVSEDGAIRAVEGSTDDSSGLDPLADGSPVVCFE